MKHPTQTHTLAPGPLILSGASGASGAALSGAGLLAVGAWCSSGAEWCKTGRDSPLKPVMTIPPLARRALTGDRPETAARLLPLFSGAKVASGQPLPASFFDGHTFCAAWISVCITNMTLFAVIAHRMGRFCNRLKAPPALAFGDLAEKLSTTAPRINYA